MEPYVTRQNGVDQKQSSYLKAIVLIQRSGLLQEYIASINSDMVYSILDTLFQSVQLYTELSLSMREYSQRLLNFVYDNVPVTTIQTLIRCILNEDTTASGRPLTKGHHFLTLLHSMLTRLLLRCTPSQLESLLINSLTQEKVDLLIHLTEAVAGPQRDLDGLIPMLTSSESSLLFRTLVLSHWDTLVTFRPSDDLWLSVLTNIVHVKCHPGYLSQFQPVVNWYFLMLESPIRGLHDKLHYVKLVSSFLHNTLSTSEHTSSGDDTETRLLVTMETLLLSCDRTEEGKCNTVLLYTELQRGVAKCLNWGLLKLLAQFVCNNDNPRLDFASCVPPLLSSLGPAHFPSLLSRLYSLLEFNAQPLPAAHARCTLLDAVFMSCMRECYQRSALVEFYTENKMADILNNLERDVEGEAEIVEQLLVTKLVTVRVMEGLLQVSKTDLAESLESRRKTVMKFIYNRILKSNLEFTQSDYCSYLNRQLHSAAYVVTCVWISNTGADVDLYTLLFKEDIKEEKFIFKHFLHLDKEYKFPIEFNEAPREKKLLTGIRRQGPVGTEQEQYQSIDLFSSSLADDITRHDFTSSKLTPSASSGNNVTLTLELDEINTSEPMQVLTALLHQMEDRGLMSQPEDGTEFGPNWLETFISCLDSPGQERNVRVWLIKLVVNCGHILARFAVRLYPVLVRVITAGVLGSHINYFLNDVLLVLLRWNTTALPQPDTAQDLLCYLFGLVHHANDAIVKYNLELIRNLLSVWKPILDPTRLPHSAILSLVTSLNPDILYTGLKLSEILLVEQLPPYNATTERNYLKCIIELWKTKAKDSKGNTSKIPSGGSKLNNVLAVVTGGLLISFSEGKLQDDHQIGEFVRRKFESMVKSGAQNLVSSLYFVSRLYPVILDNFLNDIISSYSKVSGKPKEYCLNMVECVYKRNNKKDMWNTLRQMGVMDILEHKQHELLPAVLNLFNSIKNQLDPTRFSVKDSLLPFLRSLRRHVDSVNPQIRTRVFELVFDVYSRWFLMREGEREEKESSLIIY
uniref:DNA-dependent protein kinase catalytic subunit n=1 Tax=Cacopsylla melanoneura TaxID=428564 RepID=A0A8D9AJA4_9HEMI